MTKNRSAPAEVIGSCQKVLLIAGFWSHLRVYSFKTFAESSFYLLVFILHLAYVLPSPQSAVCIFRQTQQAPGPRVFHRPRDPVFSIDPGTPHPDPVLSTTVNPPPHRQSGDTSRISSRNGKFRKQSHSYNRCYIWSWQ